MGIVGAYLLHVYCDHPAHAYPDGSGFDLEHKAEFVGPSRVAAHRDAAAAGWYINIAGRCLCPVHSKELPAALRPAR